VILPALGAAGVGADTARWSDAAAGTQTHELYRGLLRLILPRAADVSRSRYAVSDCCPSHYHHICFLHVFLMTAFIKDLLQLKSGQRDEVLEMV